MGIISSSPQENQNTKENSQEIEKKSPKVIKETKKITKAKKKLKVAKNSNNNPKLKSKTIYTNATKRIFTNKILRTKRPLYNINTFSIKTPYSKEKPKISINKEIKNIIFQNNKRNAISQDNKNKNKAKLKKKFEIIQKKQKIKKYNINYNHYSEDLDDDDFDIIYNDDDFIDESIQVICPTTKNINNKKTLKEKINNTKKNIIILRKKLNSDINNSAKKMNIKIKDKNKISNNEINNNIKANKISNTIFINNSNITISNNNSQRNHYKKKLIKKNNNNSINVESYHNLSNYNLNTIEKDDIMKNVFSKKIASITNPRINKHFYYTESTLSFNNVSVNTSLKKFLPKDYSNLSLTKYDKYTLDKKDNKTMINKIEKIKEKIKNKNSPKMRKTYPLFNKKNHQGKKSETLNNKHIKKNIPNYRRSYSKSNNIYVSTLNSIFENFEKNDGKGIINDENKTMKINYNFSFRRRDNRDKNKNNKNNIQLNNSSILNNSKNDLINDNKKIKNKILYNLITKNIIKSDKNINNNINDNNNLDHILLTKYIDAIDIDISSINLKDSLINKDLIKSNINNKIIINYSKLENISTSEILFDGIIYKVVDNYSGKKLKIMERYFQLKKNCFRYFNNIQLARYNGEKPLVQFDIRHIKDLNIINSKIFEEYNLNGKNIEFCFCIFLNQNSDFFVFVTDKEIFGNSLFGLMSLLKNYYEDRNSNNV